MLRGSVLITDSTKKRRLLDRTGW